MTPLTGIIFGVLTALLISLVGYIVWLKIRKKRELYHKKYDDVLTEFNYAEVQYAKDKDKKTPQQILWDIYNKRNVIHSIEGERGLEQNEHDTGTGNDIDTKEQGIGIPEFPIYNNGRKDMEDNAIPTKAGGDRTFETNERTPKTSDRRRENIFQRRLRERRERKGL